MKQPLIKNQLIKFPIWRLMEENSKPRATAIVQCVCVLLYNSLDNWWQSPCTSSYPPIIGVIHGVMFQM